MISKPFPPLPGSKYLGSRVPALLSDEVDPSEYFFSSRAARIGSLAFDRQAHT
jgi:hypothetical protein